MNAIFPENAGPSRRMFFVIMASAVIATVFAGFAPTFYLRGSFPQDRPVSVLLHVFAILVGSAIYFRGRTDWHKRLMLSATILLLGAPMFRIVRKRMRGRFV
jgi:uncharacterized membrane protein YozB (DUF420 family)